MFGFKSSKSKWEKIANQITDRYFREGIKFLFIPYNISPKLFAINYNCMEIGNSYSYDYSSPSTFTLGEWSMRPQWERPLGFSDWFLAAFPDVAYWLQTAQGHEYIKSNFSDISDNELNDADNIHIKISYLKKLIDAYLSVTRKALETVE